MTDAVLSPDHYRHGEIEAIDAIRSALGPEGFAAYCRGQVIKYLWRCEHKSARADDIGKAQFYLALLAGDDPRVMRSRDSGA